MYETGLKELLTLDAGTLILGQRGLPILNDVLAFVAERFNCTQKRLLLHPDFMLISPQPGSKTIGVDIADQMIRKARFAPTIGDTIYLVIDGMDLFTEQAQNRLLKLFEDGSTVTVIAISYGGMILPTIRSRLVPYSYRKLNEATFHKYCLDNQIQDELLWYFVTDGCPELIDELSSLREMFLQIADAVNREDQKMLFTALSLVKEKDSNADRYKAYYSHIFHLLSCLFLCKLYLSVPTHHTSEKSNLLITRNSMNYQDIMRCISLCTQQGELCSKSSYTADNFFLAICSLFRIKKEE